MSEELEALKRILSRERKARKASEKILEEKSLELYQANEKLKSLYATLENRYQKIVEQANDIIYRGDQNGKCIFVNPVSEKILGYSPDELKGKHFTFLVIPEDQEEVALFYQKQRQELIETSYKEFRVQNKAGEIVWLGQNVSLIIENEKIVGLSGVARDITKQKQAEVALKRSEIKYRRVIENMRLGLLEVDTKGKVVKAYDQFCEMVGYSEEELLGKNPAEIITDNFSKKLIENKHDLREKGLSDVYEVKCKRKDGQTIWLLISGAPRFDSKGKYVGSMGIHMDITDQKRLLSQLESARNIAEESSKAKEQFLAHMSHEIRTPLNAVIGMTHLLEDTPINDEQHDYLQTIKYSSEHLLNMVSDILDISKIESGEIEFQQAATDLNELLQAQVNTYALRAKNKALEVKLEWNLDEKVIVESDVKFLNQIFGNLLSNAEKFTSKGYIKLKVDQIAEDEQTINLMFKVEDSGIGMTEAQSNHIFESFKQADYETSIKYGGTGLGLSIAKHLIEHLGGEIHVKSKLNQGTTFQIELPFYKSKTTVEQSVKQNLENEISLKGMSVLIAEDNPINQKFIIKLFDKFQLDYQLAEDGLKAWNLIKARKFDAVILDLLMPEMDGYEVATLCRSEPNPNQDSPIIALTASALLDDRKKVLNSGMNEHLTKPFSPIQLKRTLAKYFHSQEISSSLKMDVNYLNDFYQGDLEFEKEMMQLFLENSANDLNTLEKAVLNKDFDMIYQLAHKMKPSFTLVGFSALEAPIEKLEQYAKQKSNETFEQFKRIHNDLKQCFISVESRLNSFTQKEKDNR